MSIDERLEALAQTAELLASMHLAADKRMAESLERTDAQHAEMRAEHRENERLMVKIHEDIRDAVIRLSSIAEAHDERLDEHGERIKKLEKKLRP